MPFSNSTLRPERRRRHTGKITRLSTWAMALSVATLGAAAAPAHASEPSELHCANYNLSVALTDSGPADQTMWGQLCYRGSVEPDAVQLLVHGATYSHTYWDFPYGNGYYSYVDAATLAGYATFDVDRIGDGNSTHPPSSELTVQSDAVSLHNVISDLRSGAVGGHAFANVIWVGHSLGSIIGTVEISTYHDVNAAILTGYLNAISPDVFTLLAGDFIPAIDDPLFANSGLDSGYDTSLAGTREQLFYYPATADPNVVALDESTKQTSTADEGADSLNLLGDPPSQSPTQGITVPVLIAVGQNDILLCQDVTQYSCGNHASVLSYESPFFPPQAHLQVVTVPQTGHDLALSTTAPATDAIMIGWAVATVAP